MQFCYLALPVASAPVLIVGALGLIVNMIAFVLLRADLAAIPGAAKHVMTAVEHHAISQPSYSLGDCKACRR